MRRVAESAETVGVETSQTVLPRASVISKPCCSASQIIAPNINRMGSFQSGCLLHWVNT